MMKKQKTYTVVVLSWSDKSYRHVIGTGMSERDAERCENGVNINLNVREYYTAIEPDKKQTARPAKAIPAKC